jgi:hypothetical protein
VIALALLRPRRDDEAEAEPEAAPAREGEYAVV